MFGKGRSVRLVHCLVPGVRVPVQVPGGGAPRGTVWVPSGWVGGRGVGRWESYPGRSRVPPPGLCTVT